MKGTIKWFDRKKRYGFIESQGKDYFVHLWDIVDKAKLEKGDTVSFKVEKAPKGFKAIEVKKIKKEKGGEG